MGMVLGGVELMAALLSYEVWSAPFRYFGAHGYWQPFFIFTNLSSLLVLIFPVAGIIAISLNKRWGYLFLAGFPLVCLLFGKTAFPFVNYLYGNDIMVRSMNMSIINSLVCVMAVWLYVSSSKQPENISQL